MSHRTLAVTEAHPRRDVGGGPARDHALLQIWLSPSFPIGAFAYSHGLEKAVELSWIVDRITLQSWLHDLIAYGAVRNDLIFLAAAWRATGDASPVALTEIAHLAAAMQPSAERFLEASQQGQSFLLQIESAWPIGAPSFAAMTGGATVTLPVALGFCAQRHGLPLAGTLRAFAVSFIGNLTSAAIRLSVIGQTDAQRITAALLDPLLAAVARAECAPLADLGSATWRSDIASLQHETQHTRLFRS